MGYKLNITPHDIEYLEFNNDVPKCVTHCVEERIYLLSREFKIECKGVGVHPPLELSHQVVHLAATAMYDVTMTTVHVINSHTNMNEFSHPVPRIGTGMCRVQSDRVYQNR